MVKARIAAGSPAMDMVLTLLVVTDDETVGEALQTAAILSREHPARVLGIVLGDGRGAPRVDAKIRVGENSAGESVLLRMSGPLVKHADSVVLPLLLPDSPVVAWWPRNGPSDPSADADRPARAASAHRRGEQRRARPGAQGHRPPLRPRRHRPHLDAPHAVAGAAGGRARPVDRQGHRRLGGVPTGQPGGDAAGRLAGEPVEGADHAAPRRHGPDLQGRAAHGRGRRDDPADRLHVLPLQRARFRSRARCRWAAARWPSCWPRTCAASTPTTSTPPPSSTCWT